MNPILMFVWAVLAAGFMGLLVYRGQLTRYEDDQLFLNDEVTTAERQRHQMILSKIQRVKPLVTAFGGAAGLVTACVVGIYVWNAWQQIQ